MNVALAKDGSLLISFHYNAATIARVKTLSARRWSKELNCWTAPASVDNVKRLKEWGFKLPPTLKEKLASGSTVRHRKPVALSTDIRAALDVYQVEAVEAIEAFFGRILVADDPGLGKTVECLAWLAAHPELRPAVIISKKAGKLVWHRDAKLGIHTKAGRVPMLPDDAFQIINGRQHVDIDGDVIVGNYDVMAQLEDCPYCHGEGDKGGVRCKDCAATGSIAYMRDDIAFIKPKVIILDEGQQIMNRDAQRSSAILKYAATISHVIIATASPIKKKPIQFFNILNLLAPREFPSRVRYGLRYCGGKQTSYGRDFDGASHLDELNEILLDKLMIRRTKQQVMKNLPEPRRTVVPLDVEDRRDYDLAERDYLAWLGRNKSVEEVDKALRAEGLTKMATLFKLAAQAKLDLVIEWIDDFLQSGNKLIVFTNHTFMLNAIVEKFSKLCVKIDGSTSERDRKAAEETFQNNLRCQLLVGNIIACGDTITLTAAYDVAFVELPNTPEDIKQGEGRAYGRKNDPHGINSWFLVVADSVEEERAESLNKAARVVSMALDGHDCGDGSIVKGEK